MSTIEQLQLDFLTDQNFTTNNNTSTTQQILLTDFNEFNWPILLLSITALFGTLGNLLVCIAIALDKQLQTSTNWFLFSLAIADCLVSLIVLPLSIIKDFQGKKIKLVE